MTRRALSVLGSRVGNFSAFWGYENSYGSSEHLGYLTLGSL